MIPLVNGVFELVELSFSKSDTQIQRNTKIKYNNIVRFLRKNEEKIIIKSKKIYNMKIKHTLFENYDQVTCDFKLLKEKAVLFNNLQKQSVQGAV